MTQWLANTMQQIMDFSNILNASIAASWMVLAVVVMRFILKKAPRWSHVALWGLVALRLLLPFSIESPFSLIPSTETVPREILVSEGEALQGTASLDIVSNPVFPDSVTVDTGEPVDRVQISMVKMTPIWIAGMVALLAYTAISYWRLQCKVREATILRDNIYQSENVGSPFVLGIVRPKIYLPYNMDGQDLRHVVAHEQAHIRGRDHWWKPLGFLLLTIHWFNPLMWLAYVLLCRDIELACDEKVIKELGNEQRADYTQALVACSVNRRMIAACPLAFGEVGVKERVKAVMNYKKPAFWIIVAAVIACIAVAVCFLTNPKDAIEGYYQIEGYGISNGSEYHIVVNDGVELKCTKEQYEQVRRLVERFRTGEMKDTPIHVKYKQFLISYKRGTVIELEIPEDECVGKTYVYEKEGILGSFAITLYKDGTFTYLEGMASSYLGIGSWEQEGDNITLTDDGHGGYGLVNHFKLDGDDLVFVERDSANFVYVKVKDGEKFHCTGEAFKPNSEVDEPAQLGGSQILSLNDVIMLSQKGYDLTWADFEQFRYIETGSGLYIRVYEINEMYQLWIGGGGPDSDPMYIYLALADDIDTRIDIRDGGVTDFIAADHSAVLLSNAINDAILDNFKSSDPDGLLHRASFVSLAQQELCIDSEPASPMQVTVYGMALHEKYGYAGATFRVVESWYIPAKLTFEKTPHGALHLLDTWFPNLPHESWDQYADAVYEQFSMYSEDLADSILYGILDELYLAQLKRDCYDQAVRYGGVDTDYVVEQLFEEMESSPPAYSSAPADYILKHSNVCRELSYYGSYTLQYIFSQFLDGNQTGLRGHLMREVLDDLAPEAQLRLYAETGQEYFDEWKTAAIRVSEQHDMEWIKENQPAIWLFLQMIDE